MADSIASATAEYYPFAKAGEPRSQLAIGIVRITAGAPIFLTKSTILVPGLSYELVGLERRGLTSPAPTTLHAPMLSLSLVKTVSSRLTLVGSLGNGFASDFSRPVQSSDFVFTGMALGIYKLTDTFSIGAGIGYDLRTGTLSPIPLVPFNWRISENARLRGILPASVAAEYRPAKWMSAGLRGALEGNRYHLNPEKFGVDDLQLAYSTFNVGPKLTFNLGHLMNIDLYANVPVYRRYTAYFQGNDVGNVDLSPVVGYGVRFWIGPSGWDPRK